MSSWLYDMARNAYRGIRGLPVAPLVLLGHTNSIRSVAFLSDGQQVISGADDNTVRLWSAGDGHKVETVTEQGSWVLAVAASSNGQWIATGGCQNKITIWDATTHKKVVELEGHSDWIRSLVFSTDSKKIASGSNDRTVIVWHTTMGDRLAGPLKGHTNPVHSVDFCPNGDKVATCDVLEIRVWHSQLVIPPIQVDACSVTWTPNGQQLIAGCYNGSIKIYDSSAGSLLSEWNGHTYMVGSIAISPNGKFLTSGSWDSTVCLWDMTTRQQIGSALQHDSHVVSVAISPDGSHLVSGGGDKKVRIWRMEGIVPLFLLENIPTTLNTQVDIHEGDIDLQQVSYPLPQEAQDSQRPKDDDQDENTAKEDDSEEVDTALQRPTGSSWRRNLLTPAQLEAAPSSAAGHSLERPPASPTIIEKGKGEDPDLSVLLADDGGMSAAKTPTAFKHPTLDTAWNLGDIRSSFPNDLTDHVMREGEYPIASGSYGDIYRGTFRLNGRLP